MIRSLKEIRNANCKDCGLCKTAEFICLPGYGSDQSKIMFIGEAPGHREDASGRPFVGKAGEILDILFEVWIRVGFAVMPKIFRHYRLLYSNSA